MIGRCALVGMGLLWAATAALSAPPTDDTLRVAVHWGGIYDVSRADVETSVNLWANEISKALELPSQVRLYDNLADIRQALASGEANFIMADGLSFVREFDLSALSDGLGGDERGDDDLVLLVRQGAGIRSPRDLAGKRVVLMEDSEVSELMLETTCRRALGTDCARAALTVSRVKRSRQQVMKLFFGTDDAAIVRGYSYRLSAELNPQVRERVQVLTRLPIYAGPMGLFSSRLNASFRDYVLSQVPKMQLSPRGQQMMELLQIQTLGRFSKDRLAPIQALLQEHEALLKRSDPRGATR